MSVFHGAVSDAAFTSTSLADVGEVIVLDGEVSDLCFNLSNTGAALTDFALLVRPSKEATNYHTIISGATWNTVATNLKEVVGTLNLLASGANGYAHVNVGPVYAVKFQASIAAGSTAITIAYTARGL